MKVGIAVNVGLNDVTSENFSVKKLSGCEKDAEAMHRIAEKMGFSMNLSSLLLGAAATHAAVEKAVSEAAAKLEAGDLFLFSFAGHGTFDKAPAGSGEADDRDESIVLTDHFMLDDFWRNTLWPKFNSGVRIVAVADCCHSESVLFAPQADSLNGEADAAAPVSPSVTAVGAPASRFVAPEERQKEMEKSKAFYDQVRATSPQAITAKRLFLSACKDKQEAIDGSNNGVFTAKLLKVWDDDKFPGNYVQFMETIAQGFPDTQTPMLTPAELTEFSKERPFTIK